MSLNSLLVSHFSFVQLATCPKCLLTDSLKFNEPIVYNSIFGNYRQFSQSLRSSLLFTYQGLRKQSGDSIEFDLIDSESEIGEFELVYKNN